MIYFMDIVSPAEQIAKSPVTYVIIAVAAIVVAAVIFTIVKIKKNKKK